MITESTPQRGLGALRITASSILVLGTLVVPPASKAEGAGLPSFRSVVERYGPTVVNIRTVQTVRLTVGDPTDGQGQTSGQDGRTVRPPSRSAVARGIGSGFIVRADGLILTNAHVVADATDVMVSLTDAREFPGRVLGIDRVSDVAVVKIAGQNMPVAPIGEPAAAQPGDWVLAIGAPFGFENSVTVGVVSAKGRALPNDTGVPFIQTDVPINPGNSGGPLFNASGEVIGINSQIYSNTGAFEGMSFSIPIDIAMGIARQLLDQGRVVRGHLGVGIQDVTPALADAFKLSSARGALVNDLEPDGPAQLAGLRTGDVIVGVAGQKIVYAFDLPMRVAQIPPGTTAPIDLVRDGKQLRMQVTLAEQRTVEDLLRGTGAEALSEVGLVVRAMTRSEQLRTGATGLLVVEAQGSALKAGIETGDVLASINGSKVETVAQLRNAIVSSRRIAVLVLHDDARKYIALPTRPS